MRTKTAWRGGLALIGVCCALAGGAAVAEPAELPVIVRLADGATLPPDATLEVSLLDVSRADAPSVTISERDYKISELPVEIRLPYDSDKIDERMSYTVSGKVAVGDTVLLRTTTSYSALTRGAPERPEIELEQVASLAATPRISGVEWAAFEIGGRMLVAEDPPTIAFLDDGSFSMYGGCNTFRGQAEMGDGTLRIKEPFTGTKRLCPGPRMELEKTMVDALNATRGYVRVDNRLSLTNEAGVTTLRLTERPE
ncbi:YbaY family lipoprotein [Salipiger thiooxidans]|uniref:YbaY family lipoprotein n=1 Tax=Salipiger thiooxidans TaxID=282683 RepID=UPI001CD1DE3C|nr:YbaY family lipoprotein [Salipiger thiooxidans]MCA0846010.1 YbaY family lipoprotein [Salipiger thiooxidans]